MFSKTADWIGEKKIVELKLEDIANGTILLTFTFTCNIIQPASWRAQVQSISC